MVDEALLDTNVVSEVWKPKANSRVLQFYRSTPVERFFLSTVTLAELEHGIQTVEHASRKAALGSWLKLEIRPVFRERILDLSEQVLLRWLDLVAYGRRRNRTYSQPDLFLAATALHHNLTLVTRNTRDFLDIPGIQLLNPWDPAP